MPTAVMPTGVEHAEIKDVSRIAAHRPTAVRPTGVEHFGRDRGRLGDEEVWEAGGGIGGGGAGDGGGSGAERGVTGAVECAREDGDRAAALEGRGARDGLARDAGARARAGTVAPDLSRGGGERLQTPGHASGRARAQAGAGEGRRADDEARDRGVVPRKKRLRGGVAEVEALRGAVSPGTRGRYTVMLICEALHAPRSSVYAAAAGSAPAESGKRGPKTALTDEDLVVEIRAV